MDPRPPQSNPFDGVGEDLATLDDLSVRDQVAVFTRIHTRLTNALATTAASAEGPNPPAVQHSGHRPLPGHR